MLGIFLAVLVYVFLVARTPEAYSSSAKPTFASEVRLSLSSQRRCVCTGLLQAEHWIFVDANLGSTTVRVGARTGALCEEGQEAILTHDQ